MCKGPDQESQGMAKDPMWFDKGEGEKKDLEGRSQKVAVESCIC